MSDVARPIMFVIMYGLFAIMLAWTARKISLYVWIVGGLLLFFLMLLPASLIVRIYPGHLSLPFETPMALTLFLMPSIAIFFSGLLILSAVSVYKKRPSPAAQVGGKAQVHGDRSLALGLIITSLGFVLPAKALHTFYWLMVWDSTNDALGYFWLGIPILAAFTAGFVLFINLRGRGKLAGPLYSVLIMTFVVVVFAFAQRVDFRHLTEVRAGRINQAIVSYYERTGNYPQNVNQLTPWHIAFLPQPVIIYGQEWCYRGGADYYQLGYVTREHWSDPRLSGQLYQMAGEVPDDLRICEREIAAIRERYPHYPYVYRTDTE